MGPSRSQINRLGDSLRHDGLTDTNRAQLLDYRASFLPSYARAVDQISKALPGYRLTGRPEKTPDSIVAKLRRTKIELVRMQDIAGCRLRVIDMLEQDTVVARLLEVFPDARVTDHRAAPRFGYRAVHVIPTVDGRQVEIQVRSLWQDLWANASENMADRLGVGLKYGEPSSGNVRYDRTARMLARLSQTVATMETSGIGRDLFQEATFNNAEERVTAMGGAFFSMITLAMEETP